MSVYQYDLIRCDRELAEKIVFILDGEYLNKHGDTDFSLVEMKDGSIVFSWETWHGSPFNVFSDFLDNNGHKWLYAAEYDDGSAFIENTFSKESWKDSYEVVETDGIECISIKEFGNEISIKSLS